MAEFVPVETARAKEFLKNHHHGVLATRRKNGDLQMSPVTCGLDSEGRAVISSRETAYKVNNLRRDPRAALCAFANTFHGEGWVQVSGTADIVSLPEALETLVYLQRQPTASTRAGRSFTNAWSARSASLFALPSKASAPKCAVDVHRKRGREIGANSETK